MKTALVSHRRQFQPAYKLPGGWITGLPLDTMEAALAEIQRWRDEHGFPFPMRVTQIKTTEFAVC